MYSIHIYRNGACTWETAWCGRLRIVGDLWMSDLPSVSFCTPNGYVIRNRLRTWRGFPFSTNVFSSFLITRLPYISLPTSWHSRRNHQGKCPFWPQVWRNTSRYPPLRVPLNLDRASSIFGQSITLEPAFLGKFQIFWIVTLDHRTAWWRCE